MNSYNLDIETRDFSAGFSSSLSFSLVNNREWSVPLAYSIFWQLSKRRSGNARVKARNDISGSTKKIVKQKGSGGARHGSRKCKPFVGGSVAHGPKKRDYEFKIPRLMLVKSYLSLLVEKIQTNSVVLFVDNNFDYKKTSVVVKKFGIDSKSSFKILTIIDSNNSNSDFLLKSAGNIRNFRCVDYRFVTPLDVISCDQIFIARDVFESIILKTMSLYGYVA